MERSGKKKDEISNLFNNASAKIFDSLKQYKANIVNGQKHVQSLLILRKKLHCVISSEIETTELFKNNPDIKLNVEYNIKKDMSVEEKALYSLLDDQAKIFDNVIKQCNDVMQLKLTALNFDEFTRASSRSVSKAEKFEAFHQFEIVLTNEHNARKYTLEAMSHLHEKQINSLWDVSLTEQAETDFACAVINS